MRTSTNSNHQRAMRRPDVRKRIAAAVSKSWIARREKAARGRDALAQFERTGVAIAPLDKGGQR